MIKEFKKFIKFEGANFNKEFKTIYDECKGTFMRVFISKYPSISSADIEEIYDDAILAFYNNVKIGKLTELTCSIQSYINRIGENKIIDLSRKQHLTLESLPELETTNYCDMTDCFWTAGSDVQEEERKTTIYNLVEKLIEPCKKILFSFYYDHFTMDMIAQSMGFANADVAKTQKNRCMNKIKRIAEIEFRNKGLI
ncbi:sigma-70 family RNA polymerase sigma factor [Phocaeicola sartorii]|uniref:Sigma-70 family RNA polymerase sigma factor n=1 Tax=Phocaeicola sartorii TaxID=671267 RepID=R9HXU8_9BACT|nr:sigma-70 family RNA polymerase sigma factor [Phocaeicola sartorii]EOS08764.1 sigma-70 family RNA polymerase sigma factor [Phocaeicola sartorii]MCR1846592.1 sigma-70 family RNA polymerase sigma factor [Phocaeicola sartorii]